MNELLIIVSISFDVFLATPYLKLDSHLPHLVSFICFNESRLRMRKNAFYIILKALFVLKIIKFFGDVEKTV